MAACGIKKLSKITVKMTSVTPQKLYVIETATFVLAHKKSPSKRLESESTPLHQTLRFEANMKLEKADSEKGRVTHLGTTGQRQLKQHYNNATASTDSCQILTCVFGYNLQPCMSLVVQNRFLVC